MTRPRLRAAAPRSRGRCSSCWAGCSKAWGDAQAARAALSAGLLVAACGGPPAPSAPAGPARVDTGRALDDRYCALCHGAGAVGYSADNASQLKNRTFLGTVTDEHLRVAIESGRPGTPMSAFGVARRGPLAASDVGALIAYLRSLGDGAAMDVHRAGASGNAAAGGKIYGARCAACHGPKGEGRTAISLNNPTFLATASDGFIRYAIEHGRPGTPMPAFGKLLAPSEPRRSHRGDSRVGEAHRPGDGGRHLAPRRGGFGDSPPGSAPEILPSGGSLRAGGRGRRGAAHWRAFGGARCAPALRLARRSHPRRHARPLSRQPRHHRRGPAPRRHLDHRLLRLPARGLRQGRGRAARARVFEHGRPRRRHPDLAGARLSDATGALTLAPSRWSRARSGARCSSPSGHRGRRGQRRIHVLLHGPQPSRFDRAAGAGRTPIDVAARELDRPRVQRGRLPSRRRRGPSSRVTTRTSNWCWSTIAPRTALPRSWTASLRVSLGCGPCTSAELPPGWLGKVHALSRGCETATGDWLLFSDADVHIDPDFLRRVMGEALRRELEFVTLLPRILSSSFALDVALATFTRVLVAGGRLWLVGDPRSRAAVGGGVFNLVERRAFERTRGFEWLRLEIADDVALGQMLKRSGARSAVFDGTRNVHLHFYRSSGRDDARAREERLRRVRGSAPAPSRADAVAHGLTLELLPVVALALPSTAARVAGAAMLATIAISQALVARAGKRGIGSALIPVVGPLLLCWFGIRSAVLAHLRGGIVWRGTHYSLAELRAGRRFEVF